VGISQALQEHGSGSEQQGDRGIGPHRDEAGHRALEDLDVQEPACEDEKADQASGSGHDL
jgi:hypothetical protein